MFYEPKNDDHGLPYNPFKACVVPRPIGWISTLSAAGVVNLAPFSFFNVLSYNPAYVTFSAGGHADDDALTADGLIDVLKIRPIARLGYMDYPSVESVFSMPKLMLEDAPRDIGGARDAAE